MPEILNIIHLPYREDRLQSYMEQMNEQGIAYRVWSGIPHKNPVIGINLAHKQIVRDAKERKLPYVFIAEDDIKFSCEGAWKYFLSKMPKVFDLYTGLVYSGQINGGGRIIKGMSGTNTLYAVSETFYDTFLATDDKKNLDRELGKDACVYNYYVCEPMVCYQMDGRSDHFKRKMEYGAFLEGKILYGQ